MQLNEEVVMLNQKWTTTMRPLPREPLCKITRESVNKTAKHSIKQM